MSSSVRCVGRPDVPHSTNRPQQRRVHPLGAGASNADHGESTSGGRSMTMRMVAGLCLLTMWLCAREATPAAEPDRAALLAFATEPIRFEPFCFQGTRFPAC